IADHAFVLEPIRPDHGFCLTLLEHLGARNVLICHQEDQALKEIREIIAVSVDSKKAVIEILKVSLQPKQKQIALVRRQGLRQTIEYLRVYLYQVGFGL